VASCRGSSAPLPSIVCQHRGRSQKRAKFFAEKTKPVLCQSDQLSEVKICQGILWGALEVREQWQQSDNSQGENKNATLSQPIICTVRKNIMAWFIYVKIIEWNVNKSASRLQVNAPKVKTTFCYLLTLKVHKIEIFFGFDFEICIIFLIVMSKY
jgi:hypothetical protein